MPPIEVSIRSTATGEVARSYRLDEPGKGLMFTSHPNGPDIFEAIIVSAEDSNTGSVLEIKDGQDLRLGNSVDGPGELPEDTNRTIVDAKKPYSRELLPETGELTQILEVRIVHDTN